MESIQIQIHVTVGMNLRGESLSLNTLWMRVVVNLLYANLFMIGWWCPSNYIVRLGKFISTGILHGAASLYHSTVVTNLTSALVFVTSLLAMKMAGKGPVETFADMKALDHSQTSRK